MTDTKTDFKSNKRDHGKILIIETDMEDDMLASAVDLVENNFHIPKISNQEIAKKLKDEFEAKYYPNWICVVGKSFGCKVNAQKNHYLCFQIENKTIILYKFH